MSLNRAALTLAAVSVADAARIKMHQEVLELERVLKKPEAPKLCDRRIVRETCRDAFGLEDENEFLTAESVKTVLSATESSVQSLWEAGQIPKKVKCKKLCREVVSVLDHKPPSSDVGCYILNGALRCDVDVSPNTLKSHMQKKTDMPDFHSEEKSALLQGANFTDGPGKGKGANKGKGQKTKNSAPQEPEEIDYAGKVLIRRIANLFRIYPPALTTAGEAAEQGQVEDVAGGVSRPVTDDGDEDDEEEPASMAQGAAAGKVTWGSRRREPAPAPPPAEPEPAPQPAPAPAPQPAPAPATGGCGTDSATYTDPVYKDPCSGWKGYDCDGHEFSAELKANCPVACGVECCSDSLTYKDPHFNDPCSGWAAYNCNDPQFPFAADLIANCPVSCKMCGGVAPTPAPTPAPQTPAPSTGEAWKDQILQVNVKALAYISTAVSKFQARDTETHIKKWYGNSAYTDSTLRSKINKVLNGVDAMLGNVEYVMGPECSPNTYAYVYPQAYTCKSSELASRACTKNTAGQYVFYMCDLTLRSSIDVQIETLTHEGSHHATAYTDDVDFNGGTAYGRYTCAQLAKSDPNKAVMNADNFCYYVQDITDLR